LVQFNAICAPKAIASEKNCKALALEHLFAFHFSKPLSSFSLSTALF